MVAYDFTNAAFDSYINAAPSLFAQRESLVTGYWLQGEILSSYRIDPTTIVGTGQGHEVGIGPQIGSAAIAAASATDLHSMTMLAAMQTSSIFAQAVRTSPYLMSVVLSKSLYTTDPQTSRQPNFIDHLYIAQVSDASTPLLDRFGADIARLTSDSGMAAQPLVQQALLVAAMEYYLFDSPAGTSAFFSVGANGVSFTYDRIENTQYALKSPRFLKMRCSSI